MNHEDSEQATGSVERVPLPAELVHSRVVAILRGGDGTNLESVASTLVEAGVTCLEITTNTPGCFEVMPRLIAQYGEAVQIGIGTALTVEHVHQAVDSGARFVVAPNTDATVGAAASIAGIGWLPGAFTPTEIANAWALGASAVKVFPAREAGGPSYISAVRAPLDQIAMVPTGGVGAADAGDYIAAGAVAVGAASPLIGDALDTGDLSRIDASARSLLAAASEAGA